MTDHLALAKEYIAKGDNYYLRAADEIIAARDADPSLTYRGIAERIGRSKSWVEALVQKRTNVQDPGQDFRPFGGEQENEARYERHVKTVLKDPERRERALSELPTEQVEDIAQAATEVAVERSRAARAEHRTEPTVNDLTGGDRFDPAEYWADTLVIRVNRNARELAQLIARAGGLLFGTMPPAEAFDYLHEAERLIAEARAAAQEIVRDKTEVGQ